MTGRAQTTCDFCGATDDHPKVHLGAVTKHHDCLSYTEEQVLIESGQEKGAPKASAIIEAAKSGTRGAKLLELIQSGDLPKATGKAGRNDA